MPPMDSRSEEDGRNRVWSVSEINRLVRELLEQTVLPFRLRGEIGDITIHRSGHVYLSLKDSRAQVSAVFWRGAEEAHRLELKRGMEIEVFGRLGVYEPRGQYQVVISSITTKGTGDLQKRFEELKERLRGEGLFDPERKRTIPGLPRCVGVVTSPEGAAIRDFLRVLGRRFADIRVRIVPAAVQGPRAAGEIAAGVRHLNRSRACDVIVVTRGGGSLEDLWPFNEELVARAVAESEIPVISAVGHERDFTICDFVADLRVATPSAAAELVIATKAELSTRIRTARGRLKDLLRLRMSLLRRRFDRASGSAAFREPMHTVRMHQQRVDELASRLGRALQHDAHIRRARCDRAAGALRALNPKGVLSRGYAILMDSSAGKAVRSATETAPGTPLRGILGSGELALEVTGITVPAPGDGSGGATTESEA